MKRIFSKLKNSKGETFVEVLCATLVFAIALAAVCNAVIMSNKINKSIREINKGFSYENTQKTEIVCSINACDADQTTLHRSDIIKSGASVKLNRYPQSSGYTYYGFEKR